MDHQGDVSLRDDRRTDADAIQTAADALRDAGAWQDAAELYAQVVQLRPDAWPLMIQEGHCRKESGDIAAALDCYRAAEVLAPGDADLQLQIGHALKLLGRRREAAEAYAQAVALDPENPDAWREASASSEWLNQHPEDAGTADEFARLDQPAAPAGATPVAAAEPQPVPVPVPVPQPSATLPVSVQVVLDVTDVLDYFNGARTPTGIQRVQMGIVGRAIAEPVPGNITLAFAAYDPRDREWRGVDASGFAKLCELASSGSDAQEPAWVGARDALREKVAAAPPLSFQDGALLVNLGNSWGFPEYFRALRAAQRRHGLRYIPFVHDCVPLIVPEHCLQTMVQDYARWFSALGLHAHGILCNSQNTLRDVRTQMERLLPGLDLPGQVIRLDADPRTVSTPSGDTSLPALRALRPNEDFVLFVATIESRKNHLLVFNAWLGMLREHGPARVPRLVCVGKPGWHAEAALNLLRNAPELQRHVVLLSHVSDLELAALYERCLFTVYNSHYEGWGLPITEALAHGKVVLTAQHSALTEAGGEAALYFTSQSLPDLRAKLEQLIFDPAFRGEQEAKVRQKGQPRSWSAIKDQVFEAVQALAALPQEHLPDRALFSLGKRYAFRRSMLSRPDLDLAMAAAALEGTAWHPLSEDGAWARPGGAILRLPVGPEADGVSLRLYLELWLAPEVSGLAVTCSPEIGASRRYDVEGAAAGKVTVMLDLPAASHVGHLDIELEAVIPAADGAAGMRSLGLTGLMLCRADDLAARLNYLESQNFLAGS